MSDRRMMLDTPPLLTFNPSEAPDGVYIYTQDGTLHDPDKWDTANNNAAVGVAIVSDYEYDYGKHRFAIGKNLQAANKIVWSKRLYGVDINGILTTTFKRGAKADYQGLSNSNIVAAQATEENATNNCCLYCIQKTINQKSGYLPSYGEVCELYNKINTVNEILQLIGSSSFVDMLDKIYESDVHYLWSSTEATSSLVWVKALDDDFGSDSMAKSDVIYDYYAVPLFPITDTFNLALNIQDRQIILQFRKGDSINLSYLIPPAYITVFQGWYDTPDYSGNLISGINSIESDVELYAKLNSSPDAP